MGARVRTLPRRSEGEPGPWHEIVGMVTDLGMDPAEGGEAAYLYRAASAAELDPVVVAVRVAGDAAPLAPRVAALARQVDAGLQLRDIVTLDEVVAQRQMPLVIGSVVFGSVRALQDAEWSLPNAMATCIVVSLVMVIAMIWLTLRRDSTHYRPMGEWRRTP